MEPVFYIYEISHPKEDKQCLNTLSCASASDSSLLRSPPYFHQPPLLLCPCSVHADSGWCTDVTFPLALVHCFISTCLLAPTLSLLLLMEHLFINIALFSDNLQQINYLLALSLFLLEGAVLYSWPPECHVLDIPNELMALYSISHTVRLWREIWRCRV